MKQRFDQRISSSDARAAAPCGQRLGSPNQRMKSARRTLATFFRAPPALDERGGALIEFTVMAPVFFLIVFGIIEFGSIFNMQNNMLNAARDTARIWAAQNPQTWNASAAQSSCQSLLGAGFACAATDQCGSSPKQPDVTVAVTIPASSALLVNYLGLFTGKTFTASVTMRKETSCL